jgi:sulfite reductase alpha subunit-like flavoprotein
VGGSLTNSISIKLYIQDQVFKQRALLNWLITNEKAHIYVCGHSLMADGVKKSFLKIFESESHMSEDDAQRFFLKLTNEGRYHEDVFGIY